MNEYIIISNAKTTHEHRHLHLLIRQPQFDKHLETNSHTEEHIDVPVHDYEAYKYYNIRL